MLRGCKPHVQTPVQSIEFKVAFCDIGGVQYRIERMRMRLVQGTPIIKQGL